MPLLWISVAFISGLVAARFMPGLEGAWLAAALTALALMLGLARLPVRDGPLLWLRWMATRETHFFVPPLALAASLALGGWWMARSGPDIQTGHVAAINGQGAYRIVGMLAAPPDVRDRTTQLRIQVQEVTALDADGKPTGAPQKAHGLLLALALGKGDWEYGDRIQLEGKPVTPPEDETFSYRDYLARQGIYTYLTYPRVRVKQRGMGSPLLLAIYRLRDRALAVVNHLFPSPEAPLLAGILLGIDTGLPDSLARAFQDTGTAHVIAISGFNIAILAELFKKIFGRFLTRWWAAGAAILAISGYTVLVGATPSVVRAAIMGSLALVAREIGRRSTGANSLAFTAMLMCLPNPLLPWDASFQLSFGATLGLILYGDRLQGWFTGLLERRLPAEKAQKIAGPVGNYVLMTLAAQALTLPAILYHFQRLSLSSLLANPLILPPQPLLMILSGAAVIAGMVFEPLGHLLAWLAWPLSAYTIRMVEALAALPVGVVVLDELNLGSVGLLYAVALVPAFGKQFPGLMKRVISPAILLVTLALTAVVLWRSVATAPDGNLHLVVYNLGGSPAMLVKGPDGEKVWVNGGPSVRGINDALDRWLSPFDRHLDGLIINTQTANILTALNGALETHTVQNAWWGIDPPDNRSADTFQQALQAQNVSTHRLAMGEALGIGNQARINVLASTDTGSALLIRMGSFRALIPGGNPPSRFLPEDLTNLSLVILEPRDLEETTPERWLTYAPQAIIGIPGEDTLEPSGPNWLNTKPQGWYQVTTDGKRMWLERGK